MADIPKIVDLEFDKTWTSASDFPTVETDEAQVRADLQYMPDLIRDFINNKLIPPTNEVVDALNSGVGAGDMQRRIYDPQRKDTDVFEYADDAAADSLASSKTYADSKKTEAVNAAKSYTDSQFTSYGENTVENTTLVLAGFKTESLDGGDES